VDDLTARELASRIRDLPQVAQTRLIGRAEALAEFQADSGFGDVLQALDENPLPSVIIVQPRPEYSEPRGMGQLVEGFKGYGEVDIAQYNLQWVKRLYAMMEIVQRGVLVLAGLLSVAVLLIVGNTIRLGIQNRRSEIEIAKLFGATDAFIRRPFLYSGLWYGLVGGLIAMALVSVAVALLARPVTLLAELYYSEFPLQGLGATPSLAVVGAGALLGLGGSWLAVGRHLSAIEPS
jgi:cell division transport system permease protein